MKRSEIDALVRAHRGRAHPVAFFHVLRQASLDEDDHAFLCEHSHMLTVHDLFAWRARCSPGFTGAAIRRLAALAIQEPSRFDHEVLRTRLELEEEEWIELCALLRGKVPEHVFERLLARRELGEGPRDPLTAEPSPDEQRDFVERLAEALDDPGLPLPPREPAISAEEVPEAILERARLAFSVEEQATLLRWLSRRGFARRPLFEVALGSVRAGSAHPMLVGWLASQLITRSAWEGYGVDIFLAFLDTGAFAELEELLAQAWSQASEAPLLAGRDEPAGPGKLLASVHAAFASALLQMTREGLAAGDPGKALVALSALACLEPPSRMSRSIHDLLREPAVTGEVRILALLNARLVKHAGVQGASFTGVIAALQALADARLEG